MSVYTFGAEPRVVRNKQKYRGEEEQTKKLRAPLEMAEESIKSEMERRKFELRKEQLIAFKKNKTKQTPYDLRPAPAPKIEVDLTYFLTEQNVQPPTADVQNTQTDEWSPAPPEPPYLPQKKGVDVSTQILDNDLFDYDKEVEPILHVLVSKTLEQAKLEVDEAAEIEAIRKYKGEYKERRRLEHEDWENQVKEELKRLTKKNELLAREREKREKEEVATRKLQCIHLAKAYLKNTLHNSMEEVISSNYWQNKQAEAIHSTLVPKMVDMIAKDRERKDAISSLVHDVAVQTLVEPTKMAEPIKEKLRAKLKGKEKPRKIQDPRLRRVRVMFCNIEKPKSSRFGFYVKKSLTGKLEEWEKEAKEGYDKYHGKQLITYVIEKYFQGEENIEDLIEQYNKQLQPSSMDFMLELKSLPNLSFAVASEPYDYLAEQYKRYWPEIYLYDREGTFLGKYGVKAEDHKFAGFLKTDIPERDKVLHENDDSKILINLASISPEVTSLILAVRENPLHKSAKDNWYGNARYRLIDEETYQSVECEKLSGLLEKAIKLGEPAADEVESRTVICGRIYKDPNEPSWIYEAYNTALSGKKAELETKITTLGTLMKREELPSIDVAKWQEELEQQRAMATKSKGKGKRDDTKGGKSQSKVKDKSKTKKDEEEEKEEKEEKEVTMEEKLAEYMDFPIGPLEFDCQDSVEKIEQKIVDEFQKTDPELFAICKNGVEVFVNNKQLKTPKQLLHHSHILKQFIFRPKVPQIIPAAEIVPAEEQTEEKVEGEPDEEQLMFG